MAAGLAQAAVHAAEALSVLARRRSGARELSRPAAVERLLQLLEASAHPSITLEGMHTQQDTQQSAASGSDGKQSGSSAPGSNACGGAGLKHAIAAQYMSALGQVPGIVCLIAIQEPSFIPKLEQCSTKAAHLLAAALRLHFPAPKAAPGSGCQSQDMAVPGALVDPLQGLPAAAVQLSKRWEALARALRPQEPWEQWQDSPTWRDASLTDTHRQQQQQQQRKLVGLSSWWLTQKKCPFAFGTCRQRGQAVGWGCKTRLGLSHSGAQVAHKHLSLAAAWAVKACLQCLRKGS